MNVGSFIGNWPVNFATGPLTQLGQPLAALSSVEIGTGRNGAQPPTFGDGYEVQVGFAMLDSSGGLIFAGTPDRLLSLVGEQLRWHGLYEGQELNVNIALAEIFRQDAEDRGGHPYLFGCTVYGDPDQVGVWGASGTPGGGTPKPGRGVLESA
ncbi:MAG TPA: hypothetical protein VFC23_03605 [Thermoanaerobaculia bacterium]|nr:hypothetical protein [Thermoanaerobaculia bacterium]